MAFSIDCGKGRILHSELPAFIMGIVNATPDSFFSPSSSMDRNHNLKRALTLIEEGADIIDIGGESTRPGASYISAEEEMERIIPLIAEIKKRSDAVISVDTRKATVMKEAFRNGAHICNDISALSEDSQLGNLIAEEEGSVVLMHKRGIPQTMQQDIPVYTDVVQTVGAYLTERAEYALSCGIPKSRIMVDYGIGFGKTAEDNYRLVASSAYFSKLGYPLLVGLSRKSCIGAITGLPPEDRLSGTLAATMYAVQCGASVVRVHDVAATRQMLLVLRELQKYGTA